MIRSVAVLAIFLGAEALAEPSPISPDDRIVVRAAIFGCPDFPGVLALQNLSESPELSLPGLPPIKIIGLTEVMASQLLVDTISEATLTGHTPRSVVVEKIQSDEDYQQERDMLMRSEHYIRMSDCVRKVPEQDESGPGLLETMKSIALTPNKAMKRTSLPVTSFACAKEPPATVGRLSRR